MLPQLFIDRVEKYQEKLVAETWSYFIISYTNRVTFFLHRFNVNRAAFFANTVGILCDYLNAVERITL